MDHDPQTMYTQAFWDERYSSADRIWSGRVNQWVERLVSGLPAGSALDVGCGEGGDALWLARQGWTVTAVDVSPVALERAERHAREADPAAASAITWRQVDLIGDPDSLDGLGPFDLVSMQFVHLPSALWERLYRQLTARVAPGGALLVAGHHPSDIGGPISRPDLPDLFYTPEQVTAFLPESDWRIVQADAPTRPASTHDGQTVTIADTVVFAVRRS